MRTYEATEQAYKNGYADGQRDARKHGRWIEVREKNYGYRIGVKCSECGRRVRNRGENYCPKCGADMR